MTIIPKSQLIFSCTQDFVGSYIFQPKIMDSMPKFSFLRSIHIFLYATKEPSSRFLHFFVSKYLYFFVFYSNFNIISQNYTVISKNTSRKKSLLTSVLPSIIMDFEEFCACSLRFLSIFFMFLYLTYSKYNASPIKEDFYLEHFSKAHRQRFRIQHDQSAYSQRRICAESNAQRSRAKL